MVATERSQVVEHGDLVVAPRAVVVDLDAGHGAAVDRTDGRGPQQRHPLRDRRASFEVHGGGDGGAVGEDQVQDGVAEQHSCHSHGHGPESGDLAQLVAFDAASLEGVVVDADQAEVGGLALGCRRLGGTGHPFAADLLERVHQVGLARFVPARLAGRFEQLVRSMLDGGLDRGHLLWGRLREQLGHTGARPEPQRPLRPDALMGRVGVGVGCGLHPVARLAQLLQRARRGRVDEPSRRRRVRGCCLGDPCGLLGRQRAGAGGLGDLGLGLEPLRSVEQLLRTPRRGAALRRQLISCAAVPSALPLARIRDALRQPTLHRGERVAGNGEGRERGRRIAEGQQPRVEVARERSDSITDCCGFDDTDHDAPHWDERQRRVPEGAETVEAEAPSGPRNLSPTNARSQPELGTIP